MRWRTCSFGERQLSRIWVWKECMMLVLVAPTIVLSLPPGPTCSKHKSLFSGRCGGRSAARLPPSTHHCLVAETEVLPARQQAQITVQWKREEERGMGEGKREGGVG